MSRTKIRQKEQIGNSQSYNDAYAAAHTGAVAEPAHPTESIESDLNVIRTQLKQLKGSAKWYDQIDSSSADGYTLAAIKARLDNMESFVGAADGTDSTPDYSTAVGGPFVLDIIVDGDSLETSIAKLDDGYTSLQEEIDTTQGSLGAAVDFDGGWLGFTGTTLLDSAVGFTDAFEILDDGYLSNKNAIAALDITAGAGMTETGSLQAGTLTFDVVGTAGEITVNPNDVQIANAFSKTNFSSFQATSASGNFNFDATAGSISLDAGAASNFTTSAGDLALSSAGILNMDGATGVTLDAAAGGFSIDSAAGASNVTAANADLTVSATGAGSDVIVAAGGALLMDATGAASHLSVDGYSLTLSTTTAGNIAISSVGTLVETSAGSSSWANTGDLSLSALGTSDLFLTATHDAQLDASNKVHIHAAAADVSIEATLGQITFEDGYITSGPAKVSSSAVSGWNAGVQAAGASASFSTTGIINAINYLGDGYNANKVELNAVESALGAGINADGSYNASAFPAAVFSGNTTITEDLNDLAAAITGTTLQTAYNNGPMNAPDILLQDAYTFDIQLGSDPASLFKVKSNNEVASLEVGNDYVKLFHGAGSTETVLVTDGYVKIDGYLYVTGGVVSIDTVVTDSDHLLVSPDASSTVAVKIEPSISPALYTANLLELYDGYSPLGGVQVVTVDDAGNMKLTQQLWADGTFKYTNGSEVDGYFLHTDGSGNATWMKIQDSDIATSFSGTNYIDGYTTVDTTFVGLDSVIKNVANSVAALDITAGAGMTETGSLQAGTLTFDVVGTAGQITVNANDLKIADAFNKTDFSSFNAVSTGNFKIATTAGDAYINAVGALKFDATAASHMTVVGSTLALSSVGMTLASGAGALAATSTGASSWDNTSGSLTLQTSTSGNLNVASAGILNMDGATGVALDAAAGGFSIDSAAGASNVSATGADLTLSTITSGDLNVASAGILNMDGATGVTLDAAAGGFSIDSAAGASNVSATGAALTLSTITSGDLNVASAGILNMDAASSATLDSGTSMTFTSGTTMDLVSTGDLTLNGAADGYFDFEGEMFFADVRSAATGGNGSFRLSTSATDFSSTVRALAGVGVSEELGIIDAINALSASSGSTFEKAVYVITNADSRLSGSDKILNITTADRGSLELTPAGDGYGSGFRPARDLEVWVNGILMLADSTQKTSGTAASDDYYLASNDLTKLNFAFALVAGDVVVVKNNRQKAGEDIDTGWNAIL